MSFVSYRWEQSDNKWRPQFSQLLYAGENQVDVFEWWKDLINERRSFPGLQIWLAHISMSSPATGNDNKTHLKLYNSD